MLYLLPILVLILGGVLLWWLPKIEFLSKRGLSSADQKKIKDKWQEIKMLLAGTNNHEHRAAIIEADKLLDFMMKKKNLIGDTFGDRLNNNKSRIYDLSKVWWAHKLRNQLVHEVDHKIVLGEARKAVDIFGKAIRNLGGNI